LKEKINLNTLTTIHSLQITETSLEIVELTTKNMGT